MQPFTISSTNDPAAAVAAHAQDPGLVFIAGGTDLIGLMKDRITLPQRLLDINALPDMDRIERLPDGGLRIGALARMSDVAANPDVRQQFPVIAEALLFSASGQLRNMATIGGNIMQRTRCAYFRDEDGPDSRSSQQKSAPGVPCNKRQPGSGCSALHGINRNHAIFGWSDGCVAVNPSDLSVALAALDARVRVLGRDGERAIPFTEFHRLPGEQPEQDTVLDRGELIIAVEVPASIESRASHYLKVRDRQSYEFALVSVAAALATDGERIRSARIALGGVAHKPWRLRAAETALVGVSLDDGAKLKAAIATSFAEARPLTHNAFKIELAHRATVRTLQIAGDRRVSKFPGRDPEMGVPL
jgi:xanthine dehydrogenase YagS FAD-binding subunit